MKISRDYVQSGGDNPGIMRAIQGLYADALAPPPPPAPLPASHAAPVAVQAAANPIQEHLQTLIQQVWGLGIRGLWVLGGLVC
jgi:hypothetical protein